MSDSAHINSKLPELSPGTAPEDALREGTRLAGGPVSLACSFNVEDIVVLDMIMETGLKIGVFAIDTGRLNEETYETAEALGARYGIRIEWYFPQAADVEELVREKGLFSFRNSLEDRKECCRIRKVEPLDRALENLAGWVTGLRREQNVTRAQISFLEREDREGAIIKINPLAEWTADQVSEYVQKKQLTVNRLNGLGYPSIGCAPCTRAVKPGEDARAGRWWWENPEHKECGLHSR
jgi:phosphoadenosine phosphosulfate reductase